MEKESHRSDSFFIYLFVTRSLSTEVCIVNVGGSPGRSRALRNCPTEDFSKEYGLSLAKILTYF